MAHYARWPQPIPSFLRITTMIIIFLLSQLKKNQKRIEDVLSNKKDYVVEYVDIAASEADKQKMRELMGDSKGLPPQIFRGEKYLGVSI